MVVARFTIDSKTLLFTTETISFVFFQLSSLTRQISANSDPGTAILPGYFRRFSQSKFRETKWH